MSVEVGLGGLIGQVRAEGTVESERDALERFVQGTVDGDGRSGCVDDSSEQQQLTGTRGEAKGGDVDHGRLEYSGLVEWFAVGAQVEELLGRERQRPGQTFAGCFLGEVREVKQGLALEGALDELELLFLQDALQHKLFERNRMPSDPIHQDPHLLSLLHQHQDAHHAPCLCRRLEYRIRCVRQLMQVEKAVAHHIDRHTQPFGHRLGDKDRIGESIALG